MSEIAPSASHAASSQLRLAALLLVPVLALLAIVYFAFLRPDYALLASDLRPEEAGAIVQELKKQDIPYRLERSGSAILVPESEADELRLSIVSGGIANPGSVGFELFNESDMGLTDFAQKVNYQRALQGELARTIMGMDGIAFARVHLALPERSLFRSNRSAPSAAVTVVPKPGTSLDGARIAGIQRLVASTVTDLATANVAVLNQRGQLVTLDPDLASPGRMANASPLERAYAERLRRAIAAFAPELAFELKVTTIPIAPPSAAPTSAAPPGAAPKSTVPPGAAPSAPASAPAPERDHSIRVVMFTAALAAPEQQADLSRIIAQVIGARPELGDDIQFSVMPPIASGIPSKPAAASARPAAAGAGELLPAWWFEASLLITLAIGLALALFVHGRRKVVRREQLYHRIRDQLRIEQMGA